VTAPRLLGLLRVLKQRDISIEEKVQLVSQCFFSVSSPAVSAPFPLKGSYACHKPISTYSNTFQLLNIFKTSAQIHRFPTSCAILIGGATLLPRFVKAFLYNLSKRSGFESILASYNGYTRSIRITCIFLSALLSFHLLNHDDTWKRKRAQSGGLISPPTTFDLPNQHHLPAHLPPQLAGKTTDFTLFATTRALSVLTLTLWNRTQSSRYHPTHTKPKLANLLTRIADPAIFSLSAAIIMHAWLYTPTRLPRNYNHWIQKAANIDPRFLQVLRLAKTGDWKYGVDNGPPNKLLRGVAKDLGLPEEWGDPAITVPIKCDLVHSGCGPSCELHAIWRLYRAWLLGMEMYLPLQLILRLIRRPTLNSLFKALASASRSAAFLGAFISLFYYGVCLARTRLGPFLLPPTNKKWSISPQMWDGGLCILSGCMLCGWSILVETPGRRGEVAFFVAPRALATLLPRVYDARYRWREGVAFAASVAVVLDAVLVDKRRVRGVLGNVLARVLMER
jgi:hypothetical protein